VSVQFTCLVALVACSGAVAVGTLGGLGYGQLGGGLSLGGLGYGGLGHGLGIQKVAIAAPQYVQAAPVIKTVVAEPIVSILNRSFLVS